MGENLAMITGNLNTADEIERAFEKGQRVIFTSRNSPSNRGDMSRTAIPDFELFVYENVITDCERRQPQEVGGEHYKQGLQVTPWELQRTMVTSGSAFIDARRADAIKYTWRMKGDLAKLAEDLKKARHCLDEAIKELLKEKA